MASAELRKLYKLHLVDSAIVEIRKRAGALDSGKKLAAEIKLLEAQVEASPGKKLQSEFNDLELKQRSLQDKQKRFEADLYGGKVTNPREVEALQKEIGILKRGSGDLDDRLLELMDELPAAKAALDKINTQISIRRKLLAESQKSALEEKARLEADFKEKSVLRPALAKEISPALLAKYEAVRQNHNGIGVAEVNLRNNTCSGCGTHLAERTIQSLRDDRVVTCESCHRILYYTEGVV